MPIDPCAEGIITHNIPSNTVPTGADDPCNSSNNGYFCQGSYWLYDPAEPGADTGLLGDCQRLFLRSGGDCNVNQWLEVSLAELVESTVDPVDGDDCCPPGTLWENTTTGAIFMSINNEACDCEWCEICNALSDHTSNEESACGDSVFFDDFGGTPLPTIGNPALDLVPVTVVFTNPSAVRSMAVKIDFNGFTGEFGFGDPLIALNAAYALVPKFYVNGVLQPITGGAYDTGINYGGLDTRTFQVQTSTTPFTTTRILAPGAIETYEMRADLVANVNHNVDTGEAGNFANIRVASACIGALGSTI